MFANLELLFFVCLSGTHLFAGREYLGVVCQNKEEIKFRILGLNTVEEVAEETDVSCGFGPLTGWF